MTPEEARQLLEGTSPAPWEVEVRSYEEDCYAEEAIYFWITDHNGNEVAEWWTLEPYAREIDGNCTLMAAAPGMAEMIAGMTAEYAVQGKAPSSDEWITLSQWSEELPSSELELGITLTYEDTGETYQVDTRIVMRYVTAPQPLGEEQ